MAAILGSNKSRRPTAGFISFVITWKRRGLRKEGFFMQVSDTVREVCDQIEKDFTPQQIILFSCKRNVEGETGSFKLCVIMETDDSREAERKIYLGVESSVPFDVLVYTPEEWSRIRSQEHSFARRIAEKGTVIYGKAS